MKCHCCSLSWHQHLGVPATDGRHILPCPEITPSNDRKRNHQLYLHVRGLQH
ncbi:hypothetical protein J6590_063285 [Homalodisca vitripennis]|nr:hypothetical protein J6590_063285 [Homalodisca vitripennis]